MQSLNEDVLASCPFTLVFSAGDVRLDAKEDRWETVEDSKAFLESMSDALGRWFTDHRHKLLDDEAQTSLVQTMIGQWRYLVDDEEMFIQHNHKWRKREPLQQKR